MAQDAPFCPGCGEPVEPDARFCGNCRHELQPSAEPAPRARPPDQRLAQPSPPPPQPPVILLPEQPQPPAAPGPQQPVVHPQPVVHIHQAPPQPIVQQAPIIQQVPVAQPAIPRSFVGPAFLCWFLYYLGCGIVGFIVNIMYIGQANQERGRTGQTASGLGCLWFVLVFQIVTSIIAAITVMMLGGIAAVLEMGGISGY